MSIAVMLEGAFNTGRLYTRDGQRIYWWQFEDCTLYFRDVSRMVDGYTGTMPWLDRARASPARLIMAAYDSGQHQRWRDDGLEPHKTLEIPEDAEWGPPLNL